jgi:hypothetical protein
MASTYFERGTRRHSWLRHCATNRKVVGSISDALGTLPEDDSVMPKHVGDTIHN